MSPTERTRLLDDNNGKNKSRQGNTTFAGLILNIMKGCMGSSLLSLSWIFARATLLPSLAILFLTTIYSIISAMIVVRCSEIQNVFSFDRLLREIPKIGPYLETCSIFIVLSHCILSCVSYVVLAGDTFVRLIPSDAESHVWLISATIVTWTIYFPLCLFDFSQVAFISAIGISALLYIFLLIVFPSPDTIRGDSFDLFGVNFSWCSTASVCAQAYLNPCIMGSMYKSLENRSPKRFEQALNISYLLVFIFYGAFATMGLIVFGSEVKGNILLSMAENPWVHVGRIGILISIMGTFPLILVGGSTATVEATFYNGHFPTKKIKTIWIGIQCFIAYFLAILIPDLGIVNLINGALATATLFGIFPALMAIHHLNGSVVVFSMFGLLGLFLGIGSFVPLLF